MSLSPISDALDALRAGRPVIVADDENRENEGDVILSAQLATPEWIAWTVRWSSGFICAPMPADRADALDLPPMVETNQDARGTAYTVSVDAADGITTGISAADRAHTLNVLANPAPDTSCRCAPSTAACGSAADTPRPPSSSCDSRGWNRWERSPRSSRRTGR